MLPIVCGRDFASMFISGRTNPRLLVLLTIVNVLINRTTISRIIRMLVSKDNAGRIQKVF